MITEIKDKQYNIAGISRKVIEKPIFEPDDGKLGYGIYDGTIPNNLKESSARWVIKPGRSSRAMELIDNNYQAIRSISDGSGYMLMILSENQLVCYPVKAGDQISFGIGYSSVDCMIASPDGPGLEMVELGTPVFNPSAEREVKPGDKNIPKEFFKIKKLLEQGKETQAFNILKKYQNENKK
ncbi:MAG: hypothetical protein PHX84_03660 [Candidatus Shapirobacteria bacterium]|nr:hypothetical protein [Candidatus Shapirobacteria bacterium]